MRLKNQINYHFTYLTYILGLLFSLSNTYSSDFQTPRTMALGGSGHGAPLHGDPIYLNPSFTSFLQAYNLGFSYMFFNPNNPNDPISSSFRGMEWNVSVIDGRSELFQAGVSFTRRQDFRMLHLAVSKAAMRNLSLGAGGKIFFPQDGSSNQIMDATFSATYLVNEMIQVAVIGDNLVESSTGLAQGLNREIILGTKINLSGIAMVYLDPHFYPTAPASLPNYGHELGVELTIFKDLFIRGGSYKNSMVPFLGQKGSGWGAGLGWIAPRISLDYGFSLSSEPVQATAHSLGFTVYL